MGQRLKSKISNINKDKLRKIILGSREDDGLLKKIIVYALLICIGFVYLYPILYMISNSFMTVDDLLDTSISWIPSKLNINNYRQASLSMKYLQSFFRTIIIAGLPTVLNVIICSFVGYGFARFDFKGKRLMLGLLIFSFILPPQITMMPTYMLYSKMKLIGSLNAFILPALLGQGLNSQIFILIFYQFFKQVPKALIEAAQIDGAGFFKSFVRISMPSAKPAILTVFLFSFVWYWNESYLTQLYVSGIFLKGNWTSLVVKLKEFDANYNQALASTTIGVATTNNESIRMAATMLTILPVLVMYFILQRYFVESIDRTGITGE